MSKTQDVFIKYHTILPFPWSIKKIKKANLNPSEFLIGFGRELEACEDAKDPETQRLLAMMKTLEMLPAS